MSLHLGHAAVTAVGCVLPAVATVTVVLRFYTRRIKRVPLREDDWTIFAGMVLVWGLGITIICGSALGPLGAHSAPAGADAKHKTNTITRTHIDDVVQQIVMGYSIVEKVAFGMIKISVLLAYRRISFGPKFNILAVAMICVNVLLAIAFIITSGFQCRVRNWSLQYAGWSHEHHCIQSATTWEAFAITDVITDIIVLLMPIPMVWRLQMSFSKKISVSVVFLLGVFATAMGITRLSLVLYFNYGTGMGYRDLLGTISTVLVWSIIEASVAIIASCLPAIRPLITKSPASDAYSGMNESASKSKSSPAPLRPRFDQELDEFSYTWPLRSQVSRRGSGSG